MLKKFKKKEQSNKKKEDISELAKKYNIRVSNPYGCYPPDVDNALQTLEAQVTQHFNALTNLQKEYDTIKEKHDLLFAEITRLKLDMQLMGIKEEEDEEEFNNIKLNLFER